MGNISFSIITPVLNGEKTISRTIESVLNQTYTPLEYFIIDGVSSDGTERIAQKYKGAFAEKGIRYVILSEEDEGIYDAINKGILRSNGDLIGIINSDDWYENTALEVMRDLYIRNEFDLAYADLRIYTKKATFIKKARSLKFVSSSRWNHPTQFVSKAVYQAKVYSKDEIFADLDFLLWVINHHYKLQYTNIAIANFTMGGISNRERSINGICRRVEQKWQIYKRYNYGICYFFNIVMIEIAKSILG